MGAGAKEDEKLYKALLLEEKEDRSVIPVLSDLPESAFPDVAEEDQVVVRVEYSSLNYKDALAVTNRGKIIRAPYPVVPGIDLAGTVLRSGDSRWQPRDKVIATGWNLGERYWGGYAQFAKVRPEWLVALPDGMTLSQSMAVGTAGFTAMLCVQALEDKGLTPETTGGRPVVVTGASGGVGSVAVAILARLGYTVAASTSREDEETRQYLLDLGAEEITGRMTPGKPLESERWGGAVDTVGGETLAALLSSMAYRSSAAACGLAGGANLPATVFPFILRGVSLLGVESVLYPSDRRPHIWQRIAQLLPSEALDRMTRTVPLEEVPAASLDLLERRHRGRIVVDLK